MRLKIRSPYKSPSKNMHIKRQISINNEISRRSPRIKEKKCKFTFDHYRHHQVVNKKRPGPKKINSALV